jgi:transglutaminase-like putative cysteine protease
MNAPAPAGRRPVVGRRSASAERVTFEQLLWIAACLALTLLADIATPPIWVTITAAAVTVLRLALAARGRDAPPRGLRALIVVVAVTGLFLQFHTFNGLTPGTALLTLIAGLKMLETRTRRDIYVVTMIIYFLSLSTLLEGESFWLLIYLIAVCWLTTSTLLRLTGPSGRGDWRVSARYAGRLLAQSLPLAAACWLFFPRLDGPIWQMVDSGGGATSGLSDSMSPGDIDELALSDDVAFRVRFSAATPDEQERYWRGPVLHDFDGRTWRRSDPGPVVAPALEFEGPAYRYTVSLEPSRHNWLFVLDWPAQWNAPRATLTSDYMLVQPNTLSQPIDVDATSFGRVRATEPLSSAMRSRDTRLPSGPNPRTRRLALELHAAHPDTADYVRAVLDLFRQQAFFYTLTPPRLVGNSVDAFLFDTRRGFCGHYASAFAVLMRAAGIPARIVTGYQGGTYNRFAGYWILRQSDAHAWDEVWVDGRGWLRVDPTSAVAPERVDRGLNDLVGAGLPLTSHWQQRTPWLRDLRLRIDALRLFWRERILQFDPASQERLLEWLHVPEPDGQKLALVLAGCLIAGLSWLTWTVRRELRIRPRDAVERAFERLCRRLSAIGLYRQPHEGAEAFAARVSAQRPDLAPAVRALCRRYSDLRYAADPPGSATAAFLAAVRDFKPRGSRGSS